MSDAVASLEPPQGLHRNRGDRRGLTGGCPRQAPSPGRQKRWSVAIDTSRVAPDDIELVAPRELARPSYLVEARSVVVRVRPRG